MRRLRGFTLLEMSIVLLLMGAIMAGSAILVGAAVEKSKVDETNRKLAVIQENLLNYRRAFDRIPCPADARTVSIDANFALEAKRLSGTAIIGCNLGVGTPMANYGDNTGIVYQGMVPTRTLQLPDEYAFDGWNHRIMYTVSQYFVINDAFSLRPITDTTTGITIKTANNGAQITGLAVYVLLSYGPNGFGAFLRDGGTTRFVGLAPDADELINCHCDSSATPAAPFIPTFIQKNLLENSTANATRFDDIIVYGRRKDLRMLSE